MIGRMLESWAYHYLKTRGWFPTRPVPDSVERNIDRAEQQLREIRATLTMLRAERAVATRDYREANTHNGGSGGYGASAPHG